MLLVYDHYTYFNSLSAEINLRCQILTSKVGARAEKVKADSHSPSKHETLTQYRPNVGLPSTTSAQHWASIVSMSRVYWATTLARYIYSGDDYDAL